MCLADVSADLDEEIEELSQQSIIVNTRVLILLLTNFYFLSTFLLF